MTRVMCQHCGVDILLDADAMLDAGADLTCQECGEHTVVDLFTPQERKEMYEALAEHRAQEARWLDR